MKKDKVMINKRKAILITGSAGLIGSKFAQWVLDNQPEYYVIGVDNMFGGYEENLPDNPRYFHFCMNVEDDEFENVFKSNFFEIEYVFHMACYAAEGLSPFVRKFNWTNNAISTANVINMCIKYNVKRLVYTSSMSVYGEGNGAERFDEDLTPAPLDPYAISKYACEMDIQSAGLTHDLDWCIIRPHNVYGENQNIWDRYRNVLGIWIYQKLNGEPLTIYGDGEQSRAFSYIDDSLPCFWNAAVYEKASKQIVNLGGMTGCTIKEACEIAQRVMEYDKVEYREARMEVKHAVPSYQKSIDILDYNETISLEEGFRRMYEWAQTQPNRERFKWPFYEIEQKIYSYWK